jgi:hypothetical protein
MSVTSSQGTSVSFKGETLGKIVSVSGTFTTGAKEIRQLANNVAPDTGQYLSIYEQTTCEQTVELEAMAGSFNLASVGTKGGLTVSGTGWSFSFGAAFLENIKVTAKVGDVLRLNYSFKRSFQ